MSMETDMKDNGITIKFMVKENLIISKETNTRQCHRSSRRKWSMKWLEGGKFEGQWYNNQIYD